jgi:hypothetical protein
MSFETLDSSIGYRKDCDKSEHKKGRVVTGWCSAGVSELELWFGKVEFELSLLDRSRLARHDRVDVIIANYKKKDTVRLGQDRRRALYITRHSNII